MAKLSLPDDTFAALRAGFVTGRMAPLAARLAALRRLDAGLSTHEARLIAALAEDLGKSGFESYTSEILTVRQELRHAVKHLGRWMAPRRVATRWYHWPARAETVMQPRGAVLVLSPWNYPVQLSLAPLLSAVAAGNTVLLKPSELAPATAAALAALVADCFEPGHATVLQGGADLARRLTALPWDHIFFTGSTVVGRAVAQAAAANLVPCTLELGGCNPCVVDATADIAVAARRIVWGKFLNAGQTCLAPNHVLVHESRFDALLDALKRQLGVFYGADNAGGQRIAHPGHFARMAALLAQGRAVHGGTADPATQYVAPTLLVDVPPDAAVLREEIFGPILPLVPWRDEASVLRDLVAAPSPLAVYLHSRDRRLIATVEACTRSGAVVVNDHIVQATVADLPFGGMGPSGYGRSHGRAGFEALSNPRGVYRQSARIDLPLRYPPYEGKLPWVKRLMG